jgi:hypothetical protein
MYYEKINLGDGAALDPSMSPLGGKTGKCRRLHCYDGHVYQHKFVREEKSQTCRFTPRCTLRHMSWPTG